MMDRTTTRGRILDASRRLFNEKGFKATTLAEIAAGIGIAQGNLTYHFPTKRELAAAIEKQVRKDVRAHRESFLSDRVTDDYVELLLNSMNYTWENRFLLRDRAQFAKTSRVRKQDPDMAADFELLHELLRRMKKEEMFRRDMDVNLGVLARSLWIVSRYWMDHLREIESLESITWTDQERGLQHHFAALLPYLTAPARREFKSAVDRVASQKAVDQDVPDRDGRDGRNDRNGRNPKGSEAAEGRILS